jgi:arylsulfatase A-like enzyme
MDEAIGRILARLEDLGLRDDTIVVFTSDNGFNLGHHGVWGKGNGTLPMNMYDSSVKVPAIFSGPSIRPGQRLDGLFSAYDMAATLLELAGLDGGAFEIGPGRSFASALTGGDPGQGHPVVVFDEYGPVRMLRTPDWKYVHRYPDGPHELYHLAEDPGEENNLAGESAQADHIRDLREQLTDWFQNYRDPAMDGANLPVTGGGQIDVVAKGAGAFRDRDHI